VSILDRYIVRTVLGSVLMVVCVLMILAALLTFIDQQKDIGSGHYTTLSALWFTALNLPNLAFEILPIAGLIGALLGLGTLARGSELTVIRATGISIARLAGITLIAGVILVAIAVLLGEFVGPVLQQTAREQKAFARLSNVAFGGGAGAWVRDGDLILHVAAQSGASQFGGMQIFELTPQHELLTMGHARSASVFSKGKWLLEGYRESRFEGDSVVKSEPGQRILESNVTANFLGLAVQNPQELTNRALWRLISYYRTNSLSDREYVFAFWSRIARTVGIAFSVLLAIPFVLGSLRTAGTGTRMLAGLIIGIGFFLLQRLIASGTIVFNLNPVLLAWLPTALLAVVTVALLARAR
jgi:lipopolysaccharide export system permease protein